jgi:DNA repair ATPase RecN
MENKQLLIENIKEWVNLDNEIRELKKQEKTRKKRQDELSKNLMEIMKSNEIDEFDINKGKIIYKKKNVKKPITKKNLLEILSKYYNGDLTNASKLNTFIMDNREEVIVETISRTINS